MNRLEVIDRYLGKNFLLSPDFFENYDGNDEFLVTFSGKDRPLIINRDLMLLLRVNSLPNEINWFEFEKSRALFEKGW